MEQDYSSDFIPTNSDIGNIEILDRCGTTSLAYKASIDGQFYFIKRLRPELCCKECYRSLFYKEYNTGKSIKSPYIVDYIGLKDDADGLRIIMEYISGSTLEEKIEKEPEYFQQKENVEKLLTQLCQALKTLHRENIVHLDITPKNIIIEQISNNIKLIDLGYCLSNYNDNSPGSTAKYSAPETRLGDIKEIDARTDIYAVGSILQYIEKKRGKKLTGNLAHIKQRCLQPQKENRYHNIEELAESIGCINTKKRAVTAIAVTALCIIAPFLPQLYRTTGDYIAWEQGKIPDKFEQDGFYYLITDHKACTVELTHKGSRPDEYAYEYGDGKIEIPATVKYRGRTLRVTSIGTGVFDNPETTSIIFPEGLETINTGAFELCRLTGDIYLPKTVTHIGEWTFEGNTCIESLSVDKANPVYDSRGGCNAIIETATNTLVVACINTVIPKDVTAIGKNAFNLYQNPTIEIPENVESIGKHAFMNSAIKEITLPDNITRIGESAFETCFRLQKISLPQNIKVIEKYTFSNCGLYNVEIPDSVNIIGEKAFAGNSCLSSVIIGCGVKKIEAYAFENCHKLKKVVSRIPAKDLRETGSGCFNGINENCILYVPRGAKNTYENTYGWDSFAEVVEIDI